MKEAKEMISGTQPFFNEMMNYLYIFFLNWLVYQMITNYMYYPCDLITHVAFPTLEKMPISHIENMIMLWNNQLPEDSFCRLKTMEVEYCEKLQTIFPSNMVGRFQRLETLIINDSDSLEVEENEVEAAEAEAVQVKKLYLSNLPKLRRVE